MAAPPSSDGSGGGGVESPVGVLEASVSCRAPELQGGGRRPPRRMTRWRTACSPLESSALRSSSPNWVAMTRIAGVRVCASLGVGFPQWKELCSVWWPVPPPVRSKYTRSRT